VSQKCGNQRQRQQKPDPSVLYSGRGITELRDGKTPSFMGGGARSGSEQPAITKASMLAQVVSLEKPFLYGITGKLLKTEKRSQKGKEVA